MWREGYADGAAVEPTTIGHSVSVDRAEESNEHVYDVCQTFLRLLFDSTE